MTDLESPNPRWERWITDASAALGLDPALVDVSLVHELAKNVAHEVERPLAPVSSYMLGVALGRMLERGEPVDSTTRRALAARFPLEIPDETPTADTTATEPAATRS